MEWLLDLGYVGMFIGAFLAATVIPMSSDILMIGLMAAGGKIPILIMTAALGNWLGGLTSYWLGRLGKWEWIEKWFKVKEEQLIRQKSKIDKWGSLLAFFSWLPLVGDILAIGMGFYKTKFVNTAIFMLIGKTTRYLIWAVLYLWIFPDRSISFQIQSISFQFPSI